MIYCWMTSLLANDGGYGEVVMVVIRILIFVIIAQQLTLLLHVPKGAWMF